MRNSELWEDFYDLALARGRAGEPRESLESVEIPGDHSPLPPADSAVSFLRQAAVAKVRFASDAQAETKIPYTKARTVLDRSAGRILMPAG
jgi:hypothetical protein